MREIFVSDLAKNLLGPRNGIHEILDSRRKPILEYITGILSPISDRQEENVRENKNNGEITNPESKPYEGDDIEDLINSQSFLDPTLNPEKIPSAMGISFQASSPGIPETDICITWARYLGDSAGSWKRSPRYAILKVSRLGETKQYIDASGAKCDSKNAEILVVSKVFQLHDKNFFVSIFMINVNQIPEEDSKPKYYIFQPQIRILCAGSTKLIPMSSSTDTDSHDEFVFRKRKFYARGHMTSAVWWDVDPENIPDGADKEFGEAKESPPFKWLDGEIVPKEDAEKFSRPHIRTEFIPLYSIPSPEIDWHDASSEKPVLEAKEFANMWDADRLRESVKPLQQQYGSWISNLDSAKDGTNDELVNEIKNECNTVLSRIDDGIEKLAKDDDARLAFCFANKAIDLQSQWSRSEGMRYRPFQIAFILMSLESILDPNSKFRDTCDLLWVPTGAGKTEAYLVLVAVSMAYRRLKELKKSKSGVGVDVISRYTLRLLTIQQFRRSLSLFTAAEKLRVENLSARKSIGWRPEGFSGDGNLIWGSTPFSVGLWVGGGVTPNRLDDIVTRTNSRFDQKSGALTLLEKNPNKPWGEGEPAQILECPACKNLLAVPEMGLAASSSEPHEIDWIVKTDAVQSDIKPTSLEDISSDFRISELTLHDLTPGYKILSVRFTNTLSVKTREIGYLWNAIKKRFVDLGKNISLESTSPSRPGYFYKNYVNQKNKLKPYDFQIFCTRKGCPLEEEWIGGSVIGGINHSVPDPNSLTNSSDGISLEDGNMLMEIKPCFRKSKHISSRIPINGLTVDQQIYRTAPTMIIATVDKFARLPFEPQAGILFGNIGFCHTIFGYYRYDNDHPSPKGKTPPFSRELLATELPLTPSFIIQDELHLLEGPLGSMTGLYESCIDFLSGTDSKKTKYVASTATIKRGKDQVRSLFVRNLQIFPPNGTHVDDRFFIREKESHSLFDSDSGRLYMGIMAPGKGALTPIVRIWSRLAQTGFDNKDSPEIDRFWTITGYFNAVRELAGAKALYRQDIPERIRDLSADPRPLQEDKVQELSGRTSSNDLPSILDLLGRQYPDAADGLFTTSMFGTGVDVSRIGIMLVNGQPKTTSSYIQSTGRVGRSKGGLVPVFFRASRPRDLSHYEYFMRNHRQLHRTVESPSVNPFSSSAVERSLGPIVVGMLRNMRNTQIAWSERASPVLMKDGYNKPEVLAIQDFMEARSTSQPDKRRPEPGVIHNKTGGCIDKWRGVAENARRLEYVEYDKADSSVILGDPRHERDESLETVFANSPQSLRELEEETGFET